MNRFLDIALPLMCCLVFFLGAVAMVFFWSPPDVVDVVCEETVATTRDGERCVVTRCHGVAR